MKTAAIVVNFNAGELLTQSVGALLASATAPQVLVIDNASSDQSLERLRAAHGANPALRIHANPENLSFARGVNQGLHELGVLESGPDPAAAVLVLNPDCILDAGALERLLTALNDDPGAGLVAPLVRDAHGQAERASWRRFPSPWRALMSLTGLWRWSGRWPALAGVTVPLAQWPDHTAPAEAVSGACMLFRGEALAQLGGLDEGYRLHCEDLDIMWRLQEAGWRRLLVPMAGACHLQGVSSSSRPLWVHRQKHLGMLRFFRKYQAAQAGWPLRWLVTAGIHVRCVLLLPLVWLRR